MFITKYWKGFWGEFQPLGPGSQKLVKVNAIALNLFLFITYKTKKVVFEVEVEVFLRRKKKTILPYHLEFGLQGTLKEHTLILKC